MGGNYDNNKMNYECKCIPKQKYPHAVKGERVKMYWGFPLFCVVKVLSPAMSCDNHPVPQHKWHVWKGGWSIRFGKIIY